MDDFSMAEDSDPDAVFNNAILRSIIKVVDFEELPKWRLVNKLCNHVASYHMHQKQASASIQDNEGMESFLSTIANRRQIIPFSSYSLAVGRISVDAIDRFAQAVADSVFHYRLHDFLPDFEYDLVFLRHDIQDTLRSNQIQSKIATLLSNTAPRLRELSIFSDAEIEINDKESLKLPASFPTLRTFSVEYICVMMEAEFNDLVTLLIYKSPILHQLNVKIWEGPSPTFNAKLPGYLYGNRTMPPRLSLGTEVGGADISMMNALTANGYNGLQKLVLVFVFEGEEESLWNSAKPFLQLQSNSLETLFIQAFNHTPFQIQLDLPPLTKLKTLSFSFINPEPNSPIRPFSVNDFPSLEEVTILGAHEAHYAWFGNSVFPKLRRLSIWDYRGPAELETFHLNFPNLKTLEMELSSEVGSFVTYAFTHLNSLEFLELGRSIYNKGPEIGEELLWDCYTGNAPRMSKEELIAFCNNKDTIPPSAASEPSSDGIYATPSFGNFKNLRKLEVWTRTSMEIEGIVFVSRPGGIPSLELTIGMQSPMYFDSEFDLTLRRNEDSGLRNSLPRTRRSTPDADSNVVPIYREPGLLLAEQSDIYVSVNSESEGEGNMHYLNAVSSLAVEMNAEPEIEEVEQSEEFGFRFGWGPISDSELPKQVSPTEAGMDPEYYLILEEYHTSVRLLMRL